MARDRKRAKQRRQRGGSPDARGSKAAGAVTPSQPVRADLPGSLDHASGEVDEFDAALVRGAGGVPLTPGTLSEGEIEAEAVAEGDLTEDALQEIQAPSGPGRGGTGDGSGGGGGGDDGGVGPERASGAPLRGGNRAVAFLRASWAELQRVQWPDRRQVTQATAVVLGFVAIAGAYLGLADYVAKEIVEFIL
ncbi:MAG: preprotein translocase subunit SecE [Solirubrobacteraceae bacterium]